MKLFLISQSENTDYDSFDSAVVCAPDEDTARRMHPSNGEIGSDWSRPFGSWCSSPDAVTVKYIGEAATGIEQGVVCSSFNAS